MKIALVNDIAYRYATGDASAVGGAERYQWLMTKALAASGWSAVIGVQYALKRGERVRIDGVDFVGIGSGQFLVAFYRFLTIERPDWFFWFGSTHLLGPAVGIASLVGTKTVLSAQFDLDVEPRKALSERQRFWWLYRIGLAATHKIFVQHHGQYSALPAQWRSKAFVMPGAVMAPEFIEPHSLRRPYVAWVGVLRQPKRPDRLIEIARACPAVEFVVCGGVSGHRSPEGYGAGIVDELRRVSNITYLGHVAPDKAIEVIGGAALLLSTSEAEGFPSVFVEAWAHGTPVVTMNIDPDQTIHRLRLGLRAPSVPLAARVIQDLVASCELREAIASRTRAHVERTHSARAVSTLIDQALRTQSAPELRPFESITGS